MKTAKTAHKAILAITVLAAALGLSVSTAWATAGSPQICTVGSNCEIGEFLYDDEYTPITTADCSITSREPGGTLFLNEVSMTAASENDGWYSHSFTAPTTEGMYRTQVCCTVSGEDMCVDKSFEVTSSSSGGPSETDIADAVWGYSNRTLSGFGTLVTDIWGYSSRSLTTFGSLVTNIWSNSDRSLTTADLPEGKLASQSDVTSVRDKVDNLEAGDTNIEDVRQTVNQNRLLLEELVNKPIIETTLEEEEVPDLSAKLKETDSVNSKLYSNLNYMSTKSDAISSRWSRFSNKALLDEVMEIASLFGEEGDGSKESVFGGLTWIKKSWSWDESDKAYEDAKRARQSILSVQTSLSSYESKSLAYREMRNFLTYVNRLEQTVGEKNDASYENTIYAKTNETKELAGVLDKRGEEIDNVLASWSKVKDDSSLSRKIDQLLTKVLAVNRVPRVRTVLNSAFKDISPDKVLKNKLLGMRAVVDSNKILLARGAGSPFSNTWLEEGSIIFKTMISNPSNLISQDVPLKYYLPQEVREEDIIDTDEGLEVKYDTERDQYFVEGNFTLSAGETRTLSVRVDDVWIITGKEIESMRKQAAELSEPLKGTAYFAQGVTLKSDIDASLDRVEGLIASANTPEQKIRAYREARIEYRASEQKMANLQELVTQAGSTGTLFGFVGGAQAIAVWGLIIIMAAGFVFLALYMRTINNQTASGKDKKGKKEGKKKKGKKEKIDLGPEPSFNLSKVIKSAVPFLVFGAMTAVASGLTVAHLVNKDSQSAQTQVLGETEEESVEEEEVEEVKSEETEDEDLGVGGMDIVRINVPEGSRVNVRSGPSLQDTVVTRLETSLEVERIGEEGDWANIIIENLESLETMTGAWVHSDFVEEGEKEALDIYNDDPLLLEETVTIEETPTGWLRVRATPGGEETTRVYPGDTYPLIGEDSGWYELEFGDGSTGWVSSKYASVK